MLLRPTRVLFVDDEPRILESLGRWFATEDVEVALAASAEAALEVLERQPIDVVLSDIVLPGLSGLDLLDAVCERWPFTKMILLTGVPSIETASAAVRRGAYDYLLKPVRPQHIVRVVQRAASLVELEEDHRRLAAENARQRVELARLLAERTAEVLGAREELAAEKERLELALDATQAGLWDCLLPERRIILGRRVSEILGLEGDELQFDALISEERVHPDDLEGVRRTYLDHAAGRVEVMDMVFRIRVAPDWRWLRLRGRIVQRDPAGEPRRIVGTVVDIHLRRTAQEALHAHMERALVTLHSIADAVITTDSDGVVEQMNPVAEELTGWSGEEARGLHLGRVLSIEQAGHRGQLRALLDACLSRGERIAAVDGTRLLSRHGERYMVRCAVAPIRGPEGQIQGAVLVITDETERRRLSRRLHFEATHDSLTGLANRAEFGRRLAAALRFIDRSDEAAQGAGEGGSDHAVLHIDLDQFKIVNDSVSHAAGDELLAQIGALLLQHVRLTDTVARFGGDEFSLLLTGCDLSHTLEIATRINEAIHQHPFVWQGHRFEITASIGVVPLEPGLDGVADVMSRADVACTMAKELGRNRFHVYRVKDRAVMQRHGEIRVAADLNVALQDNRFCLHAQPIVALCSDDRDEHYEILVRMIDRDGRLLQPKDFIPAAERFGVMTALDRWVIREALAAASKPGPLYGSTKIAINLSGASLSDPGLLNFVRLHLDASGVAPERVCFEITETAVVSRVGDAKRFMDALRADGCRFALDDFGTGLSSLTYLKELPVDYLKIDGTFVRNVVTDRVDHAMIAALNQLATQMGIATIAEYVESQEIADQLRGLGVDFVQGYHIGRPRPISELALYRNGTV